jgi:hypothetical protein
MVTGRKSFTAFPLAATGPEEKKISHMESRTGEVVTQDMQICGCLILPPFCELTKQSKTKGVRCLLHSENEQNERLNCSKVKALAIPSPGWSWFLLSGCGNPHICTCLSQSSTQCLGSLLWNVWYAAHCVQDL